MAAPFPLETRLVPYGVNPENAKIVQRFPSVVPVTACGRNFHLEAGEASTLIGVQAVLQGQLMMHEQDFEIYDSEGCLLATDGDLYRAAVQGHVPLVATLSEASVHFIQNRREELSQMQWKLLRDQLSGLSEKVCSLGRRMQELTQVLQTDKFEQKAADDRLRADVNHLVINADEHVKQHIQPVAERLEAMAQIIHSERGAREMVKLALEQQILNVRDALDAELSARRQDAASTAQLIQEFQQGITEEVAVRTRFEGHHFQTVETLHNRIEASTRSNSEHLQDMTDQVTQVEQTSHQLLHHHNDEVTLNRTTMDATAEDLNNNRQKLSQRLSVLENALARTNPKSSIGSASVGLPQPRPMGAQPPMISVGPAARR